MSEEVRPSILAGTWYPKKPEEIQNIIQTFFQRVDSPMLPGHVVGLICPHAGYMYSGQTAAYAYHQLKNRSFDVVVILSPMHHYGPGDYVINGDIAYETPLGDVPVHRDLLNRLMERVKIETMFFDQEHAIEIQLPFLQSVLGSFSIIPIMVGHNRVDQVDEMVSGLVDILHDKYPLVIASTDLHHMNQYEAVKSADARVAEALASFDLTAIRAVLSEPGCTVCGRVPLSIMLDLSRRLGASSVQILHQTTSADVIGNYMPGQYTVGYLSAAIY
jgi:AmmeMemoRadiSam system protein B